MTKQDIIQSFYQKGESDCVTIALIKVSIGRFGIGNIFKSTFDVTSNSYNVQFKNNSTLVVTDDTIQAMKVYSGFDPSFEQDNLIQKEIYEYALFCFGVLVTNYAKVNNLSIDIAVSNIDRSGNADYWYHYLGFNDTEVIFLTDNYGTKDSSLLITNDLYFLYNKFHAVMATLDVYDEYGIPTSTSEFIHNHSKLFTGRRIWAWRFK